MSGPRTPYDDRAGLVDGVIQMGLLTHEDDLVVWVGD
jgi:hypothetical protein